VVTVYHNSALLAHDGMTGSMIVYRNRVTIHGFFEIRFCFVVLAGETGSDFK
jgi:hypothetical protein